MTTKKNSGSVFHWNTGEPSCLYTREGHVAAQKLSRQVHTGDRKTLDVKGRAVVHATNPNAITHGSKLEHIKRVPRSPI
jgi:hypothetical protein